MGDLASESARALSAAGGRYRSIGTFIQVRATGAVRRVAARAGCPFGSYLHRWTAFSGETVPIGLTKIYIATENLRTSGEGWSGRLDRHLTRRQSAVPPEERS